MCSMGFFHAVELGEGRVDLDGLVGEDARHARIVASVHALRVADGLQHALRRGGVSERVALALGEVVFQTEFLDAGALVAGGKAADDVHADLLVQGRCRTDRDYRCNIWEVLVTSLRRGAIRAFRGQRAVPASTIKDRRDGRNSRHFAIEFNSS